MTPVTAPSQFRTHQGPVPAAITSPLFRKLVSEWIDLNADPNTASTIRRFGKQQPILANYNSPGQIVDAIDSSDWDTIDALLGALLRLFQDGHQLAGRILLQQFLPLVSAITRPPQSRNEARWIEDRRHIAIAELWNLAGTMDIDHYAGHLLGDIRWLLRRRFAATAHVDTREVPFGDAADVVDPTTPAAESTAPLRSDHYRLDAVLSWAHNNGIITQAEVELLTTIYIAGNRCDHIAAQMGLKPAAVSQRCHRAVKRIQAHAEQIPAPAAIA